MELSQCPGTLTGPASHMFMYVINSILTSQCALSPRHLYPTDHGPQLKDGDEFDFIVVGAGSAGARVASRLSENSNWKVLLVEAGDYPSSASEIPSTFFNLAKTKDDWGYNVEPSETACLGLKDQMCWMPRGKNLGGTSSINGMLYLRGNRNDFDRWAASGNVGWDYDSVLEHYKRIENVQGEEKNFGRKGDLKLGYYENPNPVRQKLIEAYKELGYGRYREDRSIGYFDAHMTIWKGTRNSAAKAFLSKAKHRSNLYVVLKAQVGKVLVDSNSSITGVEMMVNGEILKIKSRKEVVISAGSVNSPQILMNSGIGPENHLREIGIPMVKNLKVGRNLQDHMMFSGLIYSVADSALLPRTADDVIDEWYQYLRHQTGPVATSAIENLMLFLDPRRKSKYPTLQLYYVPLHKNDIYGALKTIQLALNLPEEVVKVQNEKIKQSHHVILMPAISYPKSLGQILLRSADPYDTPRIFTNYLSDRNGEDLQNFLDGIRFYQNLTETDAFSRFNPKLLDLKLKNCQNHTIDSDDYWRCAVRNMATTVYHLAGTCKMGPKTDPDAVVDPRLRVHGMTGIRVIDTSIMPKLVSCNTNGPAMMIGEKGASMIYEDWKVKMKI